MKYRSIGFGIQLIGSDYKSVDLLLASEMLVREYLALKVGNDYIVIDNKSADYYAIVRKKGLNSSTGAAIGILLGPIAHATANLIAGGGHKHRLVLIKLKNGKRILVNIEEGYMHLIKGQNKCRKKDMDEKDARWIQKILNMINKNTGANDKITKHESSNNINSADNDNEYYDDTF